MCGVTVLAIQRRTNCCCVRSSSCSTQSRKKKRNCSSADVAERILDGHPSYASGRCIPSGADRGGRPDRRSIFVLIMHLFIDGSLKPEPLIQCRYEQSNFSKPTASPPPRTLRDSTCTRFLRPRSENGAQAGPTATHRPQEDARPSGPRPSLRRPDSQSLRSPGSATRPPDPRRTLARSTQTAASTAAFRETRDTVRMLLRHLRIRGSGETNYRAHFTRRSQPRARRPPFIPPAASSQMRPEPDKQAPAEADEGPLPRRW
ncbi:hypothetical protein MPH_03141 [Macrophomina phaseolina MS6]|uniref:Uncharacterized protein n=1 Tax=Macrophomina phaseolina (strain MS6) TaxID=1126212 RepID=K2RWY6_MACPH|nr:hypothetical protein MPH_03141 [Macrophomina phaseolina MS6]